MNISKNSWRQRLAFSLPLSLGLFALASCSRAAEPPKAPPAATPSGDQVPLDLKLPAPAFKGTPKDVPVSSYTEPYDPDKKRPPMMVPAGLKNLAADKQTKITCSDKNAAADTLAKINDGDKEASEQSIIYLRKGTQWIQMDFGSPQEIFATVIWHAHNAAKVYHDIIVQIA